MANQKTKIIFITSAFPNFVCGVGDHIAKLAEYLSSLNLEIHIITSSQIQVNPKYSEAGIKIYPIIQDWGFSGWKKAYQKTKELQADIVHFEYPTRYPAKRSQLLRFLPHTLPFTWVSWMNQWVPRKVITIHEYYKSPFWAKIKLWGDFLLADKIILVAQTDFLRFKRSWFVQKIVYIPIGPTIDPQKRPQKEIETLRKRIGISSQTPSIAYFGFIDPSKGFDDLVVALASLKKGIKLNFKLIIVGETKNSAYLDKIKKSSEFKYIKDQIIWTGYLNDEKQLCVYLQAADLVALPFLAGATDNRSTLILPLLLDVPILSTYVSGITPDSFRDKMFLVPPKSPQEIRRAIEDFFQNRSLRKNILKDMRKLAKKYSWEKSAKITKKVYESLV